MSGLSFYFIKDLGLLNTWLDKLHLILYEEYKYIFYLDIQKQS